MRSSFRADANQPVSKQPDHGLTQETIWGIQQELERRNRLRMIQEHYTGKLGALDGTKYASCLPRQT